MANNNHKSKELFPETNAFFRGLFTTTKPEPPKTVRELRRAISASGLRHADCVERSELEKRYNDAVIAARDAPGKEGLEVEQTLVRGGAATLRSLDGLRCLCVARRRRNWWLCSTTATGRTASSSRRWPRAAVRTVTTKTPPGRPGAVSKLTRPPRRLDVTKYLYGVEQWERRRRRDVRARNARKGVPEMRTRQRRFQWARAAKARG